LIKAINTMEKEGAPDSGRRYYKIYFDAADAAHVGLAALKEVFDVSNSLLYISPLSSNAHFGRYFSGTLASSARLELLTFTRLPIAREPTILLTNIAPSDQPSAKHDQLAHSGPICCQFKSAPVCWPFVVLPVCQVTISLPMRQSAVSLPICRQLKGAWAVYGQFVRLPVCQSATSLPPRQVAASCHLVPLCACLLSIC
jgi:hypothetical protein